ncbi:MAG: alkaline phosphatase family protein [Gammaproteobacteria bacterium]|nr:alkaline phosphatase family protein [Gammaproteobacteria bacterium]
MIYRLNLLPIIMSTMLKLFCALTFLLPVKIYSAENAVLITFDGLRWQEVFGGIDENLAMHSEYSVQTEQLMQQFWRSDSSERAKTLLPFLHNTVFAQGSYVGNRLQNSCAAVSNNWYFSYPGYSEILTGVVNPSIVSNAKIPNTEITFLELLESNSVYAGQTAAFASWDVFPFIFNVERSGIHVNAFSIEANPADEYESLLNRMQTDIPTPWPTVRNDFFTHQYALSYLRRERPKVLFISYGETDDFAHDGEYDQYIYAAHRTDRFIEEIWTTLQSMEQYRDNTVLFITVDHGRGENPLASWMHHSSQAATQRPNSGLTHYSDGIVGSEATWLAAVGPGVADTGLLRTGANCLTSDRIAATLMELLDEDFRNYNPAMGSPIHELLESAL